MDAGQVFHGVECFGYVYTSPPPNRKLDKDRVVTVFNEKGADWVEMGITLSDVLKRLYSNSEVVFPDGTRIARVSQNRHSFGPLGRGGEKGRYWRAAM